MKKDILSLGMEKRMTAVGLGLLLTILTSGGAKASVFDDSVDAVESADAVMNCAKVAAGIFQGNLTERVGSVNAQHIKVSDTVDTKTYTIQTVSGGGFMPVRKGPALVAELKITQPPQGRMDAPAFSEWQCSILN